MRIVLNKYKKVKKKPICHKQSLENIKHVYALKLNSNQAIRMHDILIQVKVFLN